ncbi:hypothetical protein V8F20_003761 [Naviculisporaceae sp. PSN 640]
MPSLLGKRKTRPTEGQEKEGEEDAAAAAARELLRKHFESRFKPVAVPAPASCASRSRSKSNADSGSEDEEDEDDYSDDEDENTNSDESSDDDEWGGLSGEEDEDDTPKVEVVDHTSSSQPANILTMSKKELKAYLSSRPPSTNDAAQPTSKSKPPKENPTEEDSAAFLANDLALQRLISESHILSAAGGNASHYLSSQAEQNAIANNKTFVEGRIRRKTTDLRIQALGAKTSILTQAKMPMGMRKGINQAAVSREEKRRREARENGIILERASKKGKTGSSGGIKKRRTERPVDLPGVGKMRGSELRISARDVRSIEGVKSGGKEKRKNRGRRR